MQFELAPTQRRASVIGLGIVLLLGSVTPAIGAILPSTHPSPGDGNATSSPGGTPADENPESTIRYQCPVGISLTATFAGGKSPSVRVEIEGTVWTLPRVPSASGTKYSDGTVTFWIKGESARFESPDLSMNCTKATASQSGARALSSTEWRLVSISQNGATTNVPEGLKVDATFEDGRVSGAGVCNRYFASFRVSQDRTISIGEIGATLMMCPDHADFERQYFRMLKASTRYDVRNGVLELSTPDGSLHFVEAR